ncbi:MAG: DUF3987 domain-containing protein [bacterium]|nr:DUF3987 domain-containing protein [bacterium]
MQQLEERLQKADNAEAVTKVLRDVEARHDARDCGPQWPAPLAPEAYHGVAGDLVRLIEPETEADPAALLIHLLVGVGNLIGRGPHFRAEADRHYSLLYAVIVGQTAKGRKGTAEGRVRLLLEGVDDEWARRRIKSGLSTGEGLVFEIRDPQQSHKNPDPGESDKRLLVVEPEFANVLAVSERLGNTLSPTVRRAWDCPTLLSPMTKNNRCEASDPHISLIGHITQDELRRMLTDTAAANGFGNRFLWVCARRSKCLPDGGHDLDLTAYMALTASLHRAIEHARTVREIRRDDAARDVWHRIYPSLSEGKPGLLGAVTSRAEAQTMRLAMIYALLDCSSVIGADHLAAGLAVWQSCFDSARYIFGDALGDATADDILRALRASSDGMSRTEIREYFGRNKSSSEIGRALAVLAEYGLAQSESRDTGGRPAEVWKCTR